MMDNAKQQCKNSSSIADVLLKTEIEISQTTKIKNCTPEVLFGISLKSKKVSRDWKLVEQNLAQTLRAIFNNSDQNYRIVIAGHDAPDIDEMKHDLVTWLPVEFKSPAKPKDFTSDKLRKRAVIGAYLRRIGYSGYFMVLDADDWVHYRFVEFIRSQPISDAFIFQNGFMTNIKCNEIWLRKNFYKACGSGAVIYFSNDEFPMHTSKKDARKSPFGLTMKAHPRLTEHLTKNNKSFKLLDLPLLTYVFGHGENNSIIKGKKEKTRTAEYYDAIGEQISNNYFQYFKVSK